MKDAMNQHFKTAVLLPAKDEAITIEATLQQFSDALPEAYICVIDNNSSDNTGSIAEVYIRQNSINGQVVYESLPGKGNAIQKGLETVNAERYLLCDADLTYPINRAHDLLAKLDSEGADMVVGDRISGGSYQTTNHRRFHSVGNNLVTKLTNLLFNASYNDVASGFRVFHSRILDSYKMKSSGFELEIELSVQAAVLGIKVVEVPISYQARPQGSYSKLNTYGDGFLYIRMLLMHFLRLKFKRPTESR